MGQAEHVDVDAAQAASRTMHEECGIEYADLRGWLEDELGLAADARGAWCFGHADGTCTVTLAALEPRVISRLVLPRTELDVAGDAGAVDEFRRRFILHFVSAGG